MIYPVQVRIDFNRYKHGELSTTAATIHQMLTTNVGDFPGLPVNPGAFGTHVSDFRTILGRPIYHEKTAELMAARKILLRDLKKNGGFLNGFIDGSEMLAAKSGYPLMKSRFPVGKLQQSKFKRITSIEKGFKIELERVAGARMYIVCAMPTKNVTSKDYTKWPWYVFPKTKGVLKGLESSERYTLVSVAVGTHAELNFSDRVERTTQ
jgi:hypothetical protein